MNVLRFIKVLKSSETFILQKKNTIHSRIHPLKLNQFVKYSVNAPDTVIQGDENDTLFKELSNGDPTIENKLKILLLEVEVMRQSGKEAPLIESLKKQHFEHLLLCQSRSARERYFSFLFLNEKKRENAKAKKSAAKVIYENVKMQRSQTPQSDVNRDDKLEYSLIKNSMFLRIYEKSMNMLHNKRLMTAMQFGQQLVLDCSYNEYMTPRETINAAKQLTLLFSENREHDDPFDLHICNSSTESLLIQQLYRNIPTIQEPSFPLNVHTESYMDLFPKEKLVYLTPHCRNDLAEWDHDAVYIIGCMVDKANNDPLSLAKAKKDGIKTAKFPLDRYLQWGSGSGKSLTLNQACSIILDFRKTGDWEYALKHVPRRKLYPNYTPKINTWTSKSDEISNKTKYTSSNSKSKPIATKFQKRKQYANLSLNENDLKY